MAKATVIIDGVRFVGELTMEKTNVMFGVAATDSQLVRLSPLLKNDGILAVRFWATVDDTFPVETFENCQRWQAAGFDVTVTCTPHENGDFPSPDTVRKFFDRAANYPVNLSIGNEVEGNKYFAGGDVKKYVRDYLRPASEAIGNRRLKICGSVGFFGNQDKTVQAFKTLIENGAASYVDAFDIHPYERSPDRMLNIIDQCVAMAGDKPVWATEFNGKFPQQLWVAAMPSIVDHARDKLSRIYFYRSVQKSDQKDATEYMYDQTFNPGPNYKAILALLKA